jgi:hypothetical protein
MSGCDECSSGQESSFSELQCFSGEDGAGSLVLRPRIWAGNATIKDAQCLSDVTPGLIYLRLQGTVCLHADQTSPNLVALEADCPMEGLSPGTYRVGAKSTVTVFPDGGVDLSNCSR